MSGIDNQELVRKAVITATNALASTGKLNDAQADKFIDYVFDESVLTKVARIVKFRNETLDIDKIGVGSRAAMSKTEAVDPGYRRGISTSQVTLTPKEIMVPFEISDVFFEVNLEGKNVEDHIVQMFARQLANDLEELYIHGNGSQAPISTTDEVFGDGGSNYIADSYLGLFDGFLELADGGTTVDVGGDPLSLGVFREMLNSLPSKFRRDKSKLRFICSLELETMWRERLASRGTAAGDDALKGGIVAPFGIPLIPVPLMSHYVPVTEEITFTGSASTVSLSYAPIQAGSLRIADAAIGATPQAIYALTTDYTVNETEGTVTHAGGGSAIGATDTVRVSYNSFSQMLLTHESNLIIGMGRDIRLEKDRDIYRGVNQYAMTVKAAVEFEEDAAVVKAYNIDDEL